MIAELHLRNVKAFADARVAFDRFTVIVGANGSGKSTILGAITAMSEVVAHATRSSQNPVEEVFRGSRATRRLRAGAPAGDAVTHEIRWAEAAIELLIEHRLRDADDREFLVRVRRGDTEVMRQSSENPWVSKFNALAREPDFASLGSSAWLQLSAAQLARPTPVTDASPRLAHDGFGLADVLATIASGDPARREQIEADVRAIIPRARRYRVVREKVEETADETITVDGVPIVRKRTREVIASRLEVEIVGAGWVACDHLSEGTLITLGLVTVLRSPERPRVVMLDDIDRALHPRAQRDVVGLLQRALAQPDNAELQIIATTHSPFVVDCTPPESVRVLSIGPQGHSRCKRLVEHPDWDKWREALKAGEFWSFVGEDWLFGEGERP